MGGIMGLLWQAEVARPSAFAWTPAGRLGILLCLVGVGVATMCGGWEPDIKCTDVTRTACGSDLLPWMAALIICTSNNEVCTRWFAYLGLQHTVCIMWVTSGLHQWFASMRGLTRWFATSMRRVGWAAACGLQQQVCGQQAFQGWCLLTPHHPHSHAWC
jgi:hypothetical protein